MTLAAVHRLDNISYPLFADVDAGVYPRTAPRYHARPKAERAIAVLSVDKYPYPWKQTGGYEFVPCSKQLELIWSFKIKLEVKSVSIS